MPPADPAPPVGAPELPQLTPPYDTVLGVHGKGMVAYLTFDDGPGPHTQQVLDVLDTHDVRATFCQVGSQVADYPDTERRLIDAGHTLCNHSWSHPSGLGGAPPDVIQSEIDRTAEAFAVLGVQSHYFRATAGDFGTTPVLRQVAQRNTVVPLGWIVDSEDWRKPGVDAIVGNVMSQIRPDAVILLHDAGGADRDQTLAALPLIIQALRDAGINWPRYHQTE